MKLLEYLGDVWQASISGALAFITMLILKYFFQNENMPWGPSHEFIIFLILFINALIYSKIHKLEQYIKNNRYSDNYGPYDK